MPQPYDVITMGRIGVDLYPLRTGVPLAQVDTFGKFLGGSATNVAVGAARLGRRTAVITRTGQDAFGDYLHQALGEFGVDDRWVTPVAAYPTPVTFCEIFPPDDFPLYFYRQPKAPDLEIHESELDLAAIREARVFWMTGTGLCAEPSRGATLAALAHRDRSGITVFDLDWRPMFWTDPDEARPYYREALPHATVAVGNLDECEIATGESEPEAAARALLAAGVELAVVKQGPKGSSPCTATAPAPRSRPSRWRWSTAWAPATPSAGRCATGCSPTGRWSRSCGTRTQPGRSSRPGSPAPARCRTPPRSTRSWPEAPCRPRRHRRRPRPGSRRARSRRPRPTPRPGRLHHPRRPPTRPEPLREPCRHRRARRDPHPASGGRRRGRRAPAQTAPAHRRQRAADDHRRRPPGPWRARRR